MKFGGTELDSSAGGFARHIQVCHNANLPGTFLPLLIGAAQVGWVQPDVAAALADTGQAKLRGNEVVVPDGDALPSLSAQLAARGIGRVRQEVFDVRSKPDGPVLARVDRGALPRLGIQAVGIHVNGLVEQPSGLHLWVARRALDKALDPGKLDHIVAGGVPAGLDPATTLVKEAGEEAAIPPTLAQQAVLVGQISYAMVRGEGLRRDRLFCYDLTLPADFQPMPVDGEVEAFELWPIQRALETVRDTDDFKFNVNLVLIDLFIRRGLITGTEADALRAGLGGG
jgi:8-oxo-dGTP pyrophosphatase MutT (NUDIX family)